MSRRLLGTYPRVWNPRRVPNFPVEINPNGPLADAAGVWLPNDGRAVDLSRNGNTGTLVGGPTMALGPAGPMLNLGANQYVSIPFNASLQFQSHSFAANIIRQNGTSPQMLFAAYGATGYGYEWSLINGQVSVAYNSGGVRGWYSAGSVVPVGALTSIGASLDVTAGTLTAYVNGASATVAAYAGAIGYNSNSAFVIGSRDKHDLFFNGAMGSLAVGPGVWAPARFADLNSRPFAISGPRAPFRPFVRRTYSFASVGGAATLTGASAATSAASGTLKGTGALTGTTLATSTAAGVISATAALSGASAATAAATGAATGLGRLSAVSAGASSAAGTLAGAQTLTGVSAAESASTGLLAGSAAMDGASVASSLAAGTLVGFGPLTGISPATSVASGTLSGLQPGLMSGASAAASAASGTLSAPQPGAMAGASSAASAASGVLVNLFVLATLTTVPAEVWITTMPAETYITTIPGV